MTFEAIMTELKAGQYKPVYFLMGEEPWFIDAITDYIVQNALSEADRAFNQLILYGRDTDMGTIINSARRYPMMATRQLIVVKEAQQMKNMEGLESYLSAPMPTTILLFAYKYKKLDKRTKTAKILNDKFVLFEAEKIREDKVAAWILGHLKSRGYQIEGKAATLLVDFLGNDLSKIVNELDKLMIVLPEGSRQITSDIIEKNIGISKDYNNFELNRALVANNVLKANRIIRYFSDNPKNNPFILTLASLFYYFTKVLLYHGLTDKSSAAVARELGINPYFVTEYQQAARLFPLSKTKQIISWLREYDLKAKGASPASEGDLLKELIYKILH
ncbi:MAG TPA: DNA polymerase III subunit delta [Bacteroidales bacterium]|nr:DNA polymerase III subunit delta [Bacteroidales bacterium]